MASRELQEVIEQADRLSPDEQLQLVSHLAENVRRAMQPERPQVRWGDLRGALPRGLYGEDPPETISRERREDDEHRAAAIGRPHS